MMEASAIKKLFSCVGEARQTPIIASCFHYPTWKLEYWFISWGYFLSLLKTCTQASLPSFSSFLSRSKYSFLITDFKSFQSKGSINKQQPNSTLCTVTEIKNMSSLQPTLDNWQGPLRPTTELRVQREPQQERMQRVISDVCPGQERQSEDQGPCICYLLPSVNH